MFNCSWFGRFQHLGLNHTLGAWGLNHTQETRTTHLRRIAFNSQSARGLRSDDEYFPLGFPQSTLSVRSIISLAGQACLTMTRYYSIGPIFQQYSSLCGVTWSLDAGFSLDSIALGRKLLTAEILAQILAGRQSRTIWCMPCERKLNLAPSYLLRLRPSLVVFQTTTHSVSFQPITLSQRPVASEQGRCDMDFWDGSANSLALLDNNHNTAGYTQAHIHRPVRRLIYVNIRPIFNMFLSIGRYR